MQENLTHEIELYLLQVFNTLLEHEVRKARRYKHSLSLIHLALQAEPDTAQTRHGAEMVAINALDVELRDTDIPCRNGHEFLVLLPETDESGGRNACERLEKLLNASDQTYDGVAFQMRVFIGLVSITDDLAVSPTRFLDAASKAMEHARASHSRSTVVFSELE